ncbi:hypothetical protein Q0590_17420 [Rhodocytophaga aerolata]|uniref:Uncharacterized protein n=1 Tax=Rhodocytophaga aerolata TaxID=455078 RepID=A0ABT8R7J1_9BACT|nr:hypothetical protein [Rhodocytophaga aerolata]MDO1448057.1 hypothetical protein [Rhodocytophaga aerolata]
MNIRDIKKLLPGAIVALSITLLPPSGVFAQVRPEAGASTPSSADDANTEDEVESNITNPQVNSSINKAYQANAPVIQNYKEVNRKQIISPQNDIPFNRPMIFLELPNQTYDAFGNSPVNNNSGAYNPSQSVNMPQSTITQPPLPYKNGGTYYQANDSLVRPPQKNW